MKEDVIFLWASTLRKGGLPTQNSAQMLRLMKSHTYQGYMKDFIIPIMRLSVESRAAPKQVQKWPERIERGDGLGGFMVVRG